MKFENFIVSIRLLETARQLIRYKIFLDLIAINWAKVGNCIASARNEARKILDGSAGT